MKLKQCGDQISGLYAITPDESDTMVLVGKVRLALLGGVSVLQYRNKTASSSVRLEQARALREVSSEFDIPLIINDDLALALSVAADGVHLGSADGSVADARAVLGKAKLIGVSCYNRIALAHEAVNLGADYVALGSFFASTVKPDAATATFELLRQARREIAVPLVAIGGITLQNGAQLREAGATALAVISALFGAEDIQGKARQFAALMV